MAISYHLSYFGAFPGYQREITSIHVRDGIGGVRLFSTVTYLFVDGATRAGTRVSKIRYASVFFIGVSLMTWLASRLKELLMLSTPTWQNAGALRVRYETIPS